MKKRILSIDVFMRIPYSIKTALSPKTLQKIIAPNKELYLYPYS